MPSFRKSPSRMAQSSLCLVGLRDVLGSSFLDLQSQVFSELHDSHPCTRLVCWASVRKIRRSLALLFTFLGSTLWLCAQRSLVGVLLVSTLRSLAVLRCLQLFPTGLQLSAVTRRFVLLVPLGLRSFLVDLVSSATRVLLCPFSQFPSTSSLFPCSLG